MKIKMIHQLTANEIQLLNEDAGVLRTMPFVKGTADLIITTSREYIRDGRALRVLYTLGGLQDTSPGDWSAHWFEPIYTAIKQELLAAVGNDIFYGVLQTRAREQFDDHEDVAADHGPSWLTDSTDEELPFFGGQHCEFGDDERSDHGISAEAVVVDDDESGWLLI